jgi:Photosynthesis system II assembly factor YCF48
VKDVPKFVLKRLQETPDKEPHPDADLLTAFAEQSLVESERARVIEHLSLCSECREVVALTLPASDDAMVSTSTRPTHSVWPGWTVLRWGIVTAGIVAIASVGILQYRQRHPKGEGLNAVVLTAQNEKTAPAELPNRPPSTSAELQIHPQTKNRERVGTRNNEQSNRQDNLTTDNARSLNHALPAPRGHYVAGSGIAGGVGSGSGGQATAGAKLVPSPNVGQQPEVPSSSETVEVEPQAVAAAPATESQLSDQLVQDRKQQALEDESSKDSGAVKASPRWSISSDGRLQRSLDAGNSWVDVNPDLVPRRSTAAILGENAHQVAKADKKVKTQQSSSAGFRALAAFGTEVWAGGSAAMLYHSRDSGAHWTRVLPSSSDATLTGDITSIEFSDPQHGRISTSNGEVWITAGGGQTWHRQ